MQRKGHVFLLIGPSGSGKTTLIHRMCSLDSKIRFLPTTTTRRPRVGEADGREYFFVSDDAFDRLIADGQLLEWQVIHGNRYGTSRTRIAEAIDQGIIGITSIDILGGLAVKQAFPQTSTSVFVRPSSRSELRQRLLRRGDASPEDLRRRLERADMEWNLADRCDFTVVNDGGCLEQALDQLVSIMHRRLDPSPD